MNVRRLIDKAGVAENYSDTHKKKYLAIIVACIQIVIFNGAKSLICWKYYLCQGGYAFLGLVCTCLILSVHKYNSLKGLKVSDKTLWW